MQVAVVPEGLAAMPPGPELAAVLHAIELARVPNDRMLEVLAAQQRQLGHEQARMAATLAEIGRCDHIAASGAVTRLGRPGRYASEESRAALYWTRHAAESEHDLAEQVVHAMPQVFTAWWAGELDRPRVRVFDRYLTGLAPEVIARICSAAVPLAPRRTTGQLAHLLHRMVIAVDPEAANRWYRQGIQRRDVVAYPAADGTITISANGLPADEAEAACVRVQQIADAAKRAGHPGRIGQIRCDAFLGLLDGRFTGMTTDQVIAALVAQRVATPTTGTAAAPHAAPCSPAEGHHDNPTGDATCSGADNATGAGADDSAGDVAGGGTSGGVPPRDDRRGIEIRIGLTTLLGLDEHPAEIPGLGPLVAPAARVRVAQQRRAQWRFAVTDHDGQLVTDGITRHRPATVRRAGGPPGGIVEIHVPLTVLQELVATEAGGEWVGVIADIASHHARRAQHLRDLDADPDARLPASALRRHTEIRDRACTHPPADVPPDAQSRTTPSIMLTVRHGAGESRAGLPARSHRQARRRLAGGAARTRHVPLEQPPRRALPVPRGVPRPAPARPRLQPARTGGWPRQVPLRRRPDPAPPGSEPTAERAPPPPTDPDEPPPF